MTKFTLTNIKSYLVGKSRYWLYNSFYFKELIRPHILEQIEFRVDHMEKDCYTQGSCIECGCETIALQMAKKACDRPCYPTMMGKRDWKMFKRGGLFYDKHLNLFWKLVGKRLIKFKSQKDYVEQTRN